MKPSSRLSLALVLGATAIVAHSASAGMVNVSPGNMDGWAFYTTDSSGIIGTGTGTAAMVNGPATPPLGTGSAQLRTAPGAGDGSVQMRNSAWAGTRIDSLTALSYSTYATAWNGQQVPYLTIWLDTDGNGTRDDRLWFEPDYSSAGAGNHNPHPPQPGTTLNTWQTWDALHGMWYSDNHAGAGTDAITLAAYLFFEPNATIINNGTTGGIRIASGFGSPGDSFDANVDAFTIGTLAGTTTYDFELAPIPEPTTILAGVLLLLPFGATTLRSLRQRRQT